MRAREDEIIFKVRVTSLRPNGTAVFVESDALIRSSLQSERVKNGFLVQEICPFVAESKVYIYIRRDRSCIRFTLPVDEPIDSTDGKSILFDLYVGVRE